MLAFGPWPGTDHVLADTWASFKTRQLRIAVGFASEAGASVFRGLCDGPEFESIPKRWLVGIENGLTQPEALTYLSTLPDSEVRVPFGEKSLTSGALRAPSFFHPKLYAYDGDERCAVVSASANLTEGGLIRNTEQFLAWTGEPHEAVAVTFDDWWSTTWKKATLVTSEFIDAYEDVRPQLRPPTDAPSPPDAPPPIYEAEPAPSDLKAAEWMWIEAVRSPEGGSRNQLELILTGYHFFYPDTAEPPRHAGRALQFLDSAGNLYDNPERVVHYNGPPFMPKGNAMWRVRLPTQHEGLTGYQDGGVVIRFRRTEIPDRYLLDIAALGGPDAEAWKAESRKLATAPTRPPRNMGWA